MFDYRSTVAAALAYLAQRSGLSSFTDNQGSDSTEEDIIPYIQSTCSHKAPLIVALMTNYDIEGVKRLGFIKTQIYAFGRLLFKEGLLDMEIPADAPWSKSPYAAVESPRWYLDYKEWQWVPVPKEGLGSSSTTPAPTDVRLKVKVALKAKTSSSALGPAKGPSETSRSKRK